MYLTSLQQSRLFCTRGLYTIYKTKAVERKSHAKISKFYQTKSFHGSQAVTMALSADQEEKVVVGMFDRGLLGFPEGGIELKSGRNSPYYYNGRPALSFNYELDRNGQLSIERQRAFQHDLIGAYAVQFQDVGMHIDHIFGKAQSATALAAVAAYEAGISYLWERIDEPHKRYGAHQKIEGDYKAGDIVGMADDVVTDGASKVAGNEVLSEAGLTPASITLQFDREEGGVQTLEQEYGYKVNTITTLSRAAIILYNNDRIGMQEITALYRYHENLKMSNVHTTFSVAI